MAVVEEKERYFAFLGALREAGYTNMFGARPYLLVAFPDLTEEEAGNILTEWMESFRKK
jgi:hypothetical protein